MYRQQRIGVNSGLDGSCSVVLGYRVARDGNSSQFAGWYRRHSDRGTGGLGFGFGCKLLLFFGAEVLVGLPMAARAEGEIFLVSRS